MRLFATKNLFIRIRSEAMKELGTWASARKDGRLVETLGCGGSSVVDFSSGSVS